jgi:hypothetical protein
MTLLPRILALSLCFVLASASGAWAAGKRKSRVHGKWPASSHEKGRDGSGTGGSPDSTSSKNGGAPAQTRAAEDRAPTRESIRQESRIEFDERMLRGQSAAGVIYLFQRTPSDWKSIVEVPDTFRARTTNVLAPAEERK